ncbi:hypothetical protein AAVH_34071, partial [Aphelenchoides avenae]
MAFLQSEQDVGLRVHKLLPQLSCASGGLPPLLEFELFLRSDDTVVRRVFWYGKPLRIDKDHPRGLVQAIVEEEPSFLDVTLVKPFGVRGHSTDLSPMWPQVYIDHLPCGACAKVDAPGKT